MTVILCVISFVAGEVTICVLALVAANKNRKNGEGSEEE
jgi:hypothetical protein